MKLFVSLLSLGLLVHGQIIDEELNKTILELFPKDGNNNNNNNDWLKLEEVTQSNNESYGALERCGEGKMRGVKRCVQYHECDAKTNTITRSGVTDGFGIINIRFDANSCDDYLDVCCKIDDEDKDPVISREDNSTETSITNSLCGIRNPNGIDFKISGNTNEAEYGEFPWMAAVLNYKVAPQNDDCPLICGGSLITPNVVLTAAHCVSKYQVYDLKVRVGEWDTQTDKERLPYQEKSVRQVILHRGFNSGNLYNDLALLVLAESVERAENVGTICLPQQGTIINSKNCFVSGWGKNVFGKVGVRQAILKKIEMPTIEKRKCQEALRTTRLGYLFELHDSFMCAGGEAGQDACTGDGGSPLVCPDPLNPQRYVQVGIVAWGIGCGTLNIPGVYADVAKARSWIDQELRRLNINESPYIR